MKILYGVQGTGNGHISRARMMARHLAKTDAQVQFLFSGRAVDQYFDMEEFGDYQVRRGLSFATEDGRISSIRTLLQARPLRLLRDIRHLDLEDIDLVVTDFEPISAWAGRLQGKPVIGIGHQYAFGYPEVPQRGVDLNNRLIMRYFAPAKTRIGLHWHHFNAPILPPIINPREQLLPTAQPPHFVVYLPFENQQRVSDALRRLSGHHFIQYAPDLSDGQQGNLSLRKTNLHGFKRDLCSARGVICNAGFELLSECLHMGLPALAKPVSGQSEQLGNAAALEQLQHATVMYDFDIDDISRWLESLPTQRPQHYPDVAKALCDWLLSGQWQRSQDLANALWQASSDSRPKPALG